MESVCQVFVDLAFQGRLRRYDELVKAEVLLFTQLLEEQGVALLDTPGYCIPPLEGISPRDEHGRMPILLKVKGVWTPLWLEEREAHVFVLYDR